MPTDPKHLLPPGTSAPRSGTPLLIGIAGFVIGALAASAWFFEARLESMKSVNDTGLATSTASIESNSGIVSVQDQRAGDTVSVDSVDVSEPGVWVAVVEMRESDLGNILGAARALGVSKNISVPLLRATVPGQTYAVVLYRDNGDGVFDQKTDSVYVDFNSGQRVVALFKTSL